jgi:hypothetical protein
MIEFVDKAWSWLLLGCILPLVASSIVRRYFAERYIREHKIQASWWLRLNGYPAMWTTDDARKFDRWFRGKAPGWAFLIRRITAGFIVFLFFWSMLSPTFCDHNKCRGKPLKSERVGLSEGGCKTNWFTMCESLQGCT